MIFVIRFSTLFAVVVIAVKSGIFISDDVLMLNEKSLGPIENRVEHLIDEGCRRKDDLDEVSDSMLGMAEAIFGNSVREIVRGAWCRIRHFTEFFSRGVRIPKVFASATNGHRLPASNLETGKRIPCHTYRLGGLLCSFHI
jgi:hypothetical protein